MVLVHLEGDVAHRGRILLAGDQVALVLIVGDQVD